MLLYLCSSDVLYIYSCVTLAYSQLFALSRLPVVSIGLMVMLKFKGTGPLHNSDHGQFRRRGLPAGLLCGAGTGLEGITADVRRRALRAR